MDPFPRLQRPPNIPYPGISAIHSLQLRDGVIVPRRFPCKECTLQELCNECATLPGISAVADYENADDADNDDDAGALYDLASHDDGENSDGDSETDDDDDEEEDDDDNDSDDDEDHEDETNSVVWAPSGYAW